MLPAFRFFFLVFHLISSIVYISFFNFYIGSSSVNSMYLYLITSYPQMKLYWYIMLDLMTVLFHFPIFLCQTFYLYICYQSQIYWFFFCFKYTIIFQENFSNEKLLPTYLLLSMIFIFCVELVFYPYRLRKFLFYFLQYRKYSLFFFFF